MSWGKWRSVVVGVASQPIFVSKPLSFPSSPPWSFENDENFESQETCRRVRSLKQRLRSDRRSVRNGVFSRSSQSYDTLIVWAPKSINTIKTIIKNSAFKNCKSTTEDSLKTYLVLGTNYKLPINFLILEYHIPTMTHTLEIKLHRSPKTARTSKIYKKLQTSNPPTSNGVNSAFKTLGPSSCRRTGTCVWLGAT